MQLTLLCKYRIGVNKFVELTVISTQAALVVFSANTTEYSSVLVSLFS